MKTKQHLSPLETKRGWAAEKKRMERALRERAKEGEGNEAFERMMRSALNGRTNAILGWKPQS